MSTVRVYKVAELLDISSKDVLALLKKNHGIELKSASSTLEEIVARQFVDRLAKQKGITLPKGDMFSEQAVKAKTARRRAPGKKGAAAPAPEPPKPAAPTLGPPRLIKKAKPAEPKPERARRPPPVDAPAPPSGRSAAASKQAPAPVAEAARRPSRHRRARRGCRQPPAPNQPEAAREKAGPLCATEHSPAR